MELVYLWVEDYKNIHKQGFNFSPRFECKFYDEYDEDGKLKENCKLEIIEKKEDEYIKDFFAENINVTAIVGKNGSGKSSLLDILFEGRGIVIFYYNNDFYFYVTYNSSPYVEVEKIRKMKWVTNIQKLSDKLLYKQIFLKVNNDEEDFYKKFKYILKNNNDFFNFINEHFVFKQYYIFVNLNYKINIYKSKDEESSIVETLYFQGNETSKEVFFKYICLEMINEISNIQDIKTKIIEKYFSRIFTDKLYDEIIKEINKYNVQKIKLITSKDIKEFLNYFIHKKDYIWETKPLEFYESNKAIYMLEVYKYLKKKRLSQFKEDFINRDFPSYNYVGLSLGEKNLITLLTNFVFSIEYSEESIIMLDEIEVSFHPEWQKKIFYYLLKSYNKVCKSKDNKYSNHLLIVTHSPFLLSDIPKQNIIFLDKDEKGNCKVVDGLKKQTFGANIHTLLSDSFFMEDGLMGEFAKGKINEIKKLYQLIENETVQKRLEKEKTKELAQKAFHRRKKRLWQIQKIIGEPFLQKVIKNYLNELEIFFSDDKTLIAKELVEIEKRKKYLEALQKRIG